MLCKCGFSRGLVSTCCQFDIFDMDFFSPWSADLQYLMFDGKFWCFSKSQCQWIKWECARESERRRDGEREWQRCSRKRVEEITANRWREGGHECERRKRTRDNRKERKLESQGEMVGPKVIWRWAASSFSSTPRPPSLRFPSVSHGRHALLE